MKNTLVDIISRLEVIFQNSGNESADMLGSYIVGATIVRDDIEQYYAEYPMLEEIAELGAELETLSNSEMAEEVLHEIKIKFHTLKGETQNDLV